MGRMARIKSKFSQDNIGLNPNDRIISGSALSSPPKDCLSIEIILIFYCVQAAWPAEQAKLDLKETKGTNQSDKSFEKSVPWLDMGAELRSRLVHDQARKLDRKASGHDRFDTRFRGRAWAKIKYSEDLDFNFRLVTEPRYYSRPDLPEQLIRNEALFDILNFKSQNVLGLPMTATVGRQSIHLGSCWLILDGTPLDGGRTAYFDAIRLDYDWTRFNTTANLIYIDNYADSNKHLKVLNDQDIDLAEQDERGTILYLSNKSLENTAIDGYFIYKHDHNPNRSSGSQGDIYTLGSMIKGNLTYRWDYKVELAPQFGHKNGKSLNTFATHNRLTYKFDDPKKGRIYTAYEYLSGDPDPEKNFDKLWGRDDQWSRLYNGPIDSIDGREIDSSNLHRLYFGWISEPIKNVTVEPIYHLLFADRNTSAAGTNGMSRHGKFRGQLVTTEINYKVNKNLCHRLEGELFCPGNFYNDDRNDVAFFIRYSLVFRI